MKASRNILFCLIMILCVTKIYAQDQVLATARQELDRYVQQAVKNTPEWEVNLGICDTLGQDCFKVRTEDGALNIWGGNARGALYGVYDVLEKELGIRWYSREYTLIPQHECWELPQLDYTEKPAFPMRWVLYYQSANDEEWCAHNRLNMGWDYKENRFGGQTAWRGGHSFFQYVSPDKYFATHPEYFSLVDSIREKDTVQLRIPDGQLCLSNPEVLKLCKEHLMELVRKYPNDWIYDFSQMDNQRYCVCSSCRKITARYQAHSGLILWFVNQLADTLAVHHPDKMIGTFAYMYSRQDPIGIRPRNNVMIRLCNLNCCLAHGPLVKECESVRQYHEDLVRWHRLTPNIFIWDYAANFENYILPYPNIHPRRECLRMWKWYGAKGVMEQGGYEPVWGDFSEMKQWVLAKLLWNPDLDEKALCREFIYAWYGDAADDVWEYFRMTQRLVKPQNFFRVSVWQFHKMYTATYQTKSERLLQNALDKVKGDSVLERRVMRLRIGIDYLYVGKNIILSLLNGRYNRLKAELEKDPTVIKEGGVRFEDIIDSLYGDAMERLKLLMVNIIGWALMGLTIYIRFKRRNKSKKKH